MNEGWWPGVIAFLVSIVASRWWIERKLARNEVEYPNKKQSQDNNATARLPVPRGAGWPIFLAIALGIWWLFPLDRQSVSILAAMFLTVVVGALDDKRAVNPKWRLLTNIAAAVILIIGGMEIRILSNPLGGSPIMLDHWWWLSAGVTIFWVVGCMNAVGMGGGGVEGQLPGLMVISSIIVGLLGLKHSQDMTQWPVMWMSLLVGGAYLGWLPYNVEPQSLMPGYSGKSLGGLLLAIMAMLSGAKLATILMVLAIPIFDSIMVAGRRWLAGRSPIKADGSHLHHQLLKMGWSRKKVVLFYWFSSAIFGAISLGLDSRSKLYALVGIFMVVLGSGWYFFRRNQP